MRTLVINAATCSRCGNPRERCSCRIWDKLADADKRAKADAADYLPPPPSLNVGGYLGDDAGVTGKTTWESERETEEEVSRENARRLAAISRTDGSVDGPLPLPTVNWKAWAAEDRQARSEPCHNCPDADNDYLPLPKL